MNAPDTQRAHQRRLAVVVVVYNMAREAPRTLYSLSAAYQRGVDERDYQVIVVENGSTEPMRAEDVEGLAANFRYISIPPSEASPSPCAAINLGVSASSAPNVAIMIDGARIASPGALRLAMLAMRGIERAVVATIGLHIGPAMHTRAAEVDYDRDVEDALLESIEWRENGYRLFEHSVLTGVNRFGWFGPMQESNLIFLSRPMYDEIGGFDERFDLPGGGFVNLDFYGRASRLENAELISLFGEATFHQIHGGVMSSTPAELVPREVESYKHQYRQIRGVPYEPSSRMPILFGQPGTEIAGLVRQTAGMASVPAAAR